MATPLPGCAATPILEPESRINHRRWMRSMGNRVIVPPQGQAQVIAKLHEAHPGISRMKALARGYVWWPNMDRELEDAVKKCQQCQLHQKAPAEAPLHPWEWPGQPWSRVHIDYAGPYKGHMYLVVIDAHSKWMEVHIMRSTTSAATIVKLKEIFATHGLPETIVSDNGPNFTSAEFENFLSKNGVKHTKSRHTIQLRMARQSGQLEPSKKG